jgi:hypothetical protein
MPMFDVRTSISYVFFFNLILFSSVSFLACSDAKKQSNYSDDAFGSQLSSNVAKVIIGKTRYLEAVDKTNELGEVIVFTNKIGLTYWSEMPVDSYLIVESPADIRSMIAALSPLKDEDGVAVYGSGFVSEQFYMDKEDKLLMYAAIVCEGNTVILTTNASMRYLNNEYRFLTPTNDISGMYMERLGYTRTVHSVLDKYVPNNVEVLQHFARDIEGMREK